MKLALLLNKYNLTIGIDFYKIKNTQTESGIFNFVEYIVLFYGIRLR